MSDSYVLKSEQTLRMELNKAYEALFIRDSFAKEGEPLLKPKVCTICDTFVKPADFSTLALKVFCRAKHVLQSDHTELLDEQLKRDYKAIIPSGFPEEYSRVVGEVLLSPRGVFLYDKKDELAMSICKACKRCLNASKPATPTYAISNGYFFGTPPQCLLDLTPTELAFITPVLPRYGLVLVYHGGTMKQLKGTLSYFKKKEGAVASRIAQMQVLGMSEEGLQIAIVGSITPAQKQKVERLCTIRTSKVIEAVGWLVEHNVDWKSISLQSLRQALNDPKVVQIQDHSQIAVTIDSNIETVSSFKIVFPDSNFSEANGGQRTAAEFLRMALREGSHGHQAVLHSNYSEERVQDYLGRNIVKACLLQYPYGRGGKDEVHLSKVGKHEFPSNDDYVAHLSKLSQPHFHNQLHVLMMFNFLLKDRLVKRAVIQCANPKLAASIASTNAAGLMKALKDKQDGKIFSSDGARKLLLAVDAIAQAAPHSNQAARTARNKMETLQYHLGPPSWFVTITPEDAFTCLLNIYSAQTLDLDLAALDLSELTDEQLRDHARKREELRLRVPGVCAWNFENQLDAIIKYVIGWDADRGQAISAGGFFGRCKGFALSVEEQGRKALHMHCIVFVEKVQQAWSIMHLNENSSSKRTASSDLCNAIDRVSSCKLMEVRRDQLESVFVHSYGDQRSRCQRTVRRMNRPQIIGPNQQAKMQKLRDLRHKAGQRVNGGSFLCCTHSGCKRKWNADEIVCNYLKNVVGISKLSSFPDNRTKRLKTSAMVMLQRDDREDPHSAAVFEAAFNYHKHVCASCFKKTTRNNGCECRYRYPKPPHTTTSIVDTKFEVDWYNWDGSKEVRKIYEPTPRRTVYDVFTNENSPAIGRNKLVFGNTNISLLVPGAVAMYVSKYVFKSTQADDSQEYNGLSKIVDNSIQKIHTRNLDLKAMDREGDLTDAEKTQLRRSAALASTLSLGFALSSNNVIGPPLASYLLKNESRFRMSHDTRWVAMDDLLKVTRNKEVKWYVRGTSRYPSNSAFDYLCRPLELEHICVFDFFSNYTVLNRKATVRNKGLNFTEVAGLRKHPSWKEGIKGANGHYVACIQELEETRPRKLIQISRSWLPDAAKLEGSILNGTINRHTEEYSLRVLMLFAPFRTLDDLRAKGTSTAKAICVSKDRDPEFADCLMEHGSFTEKLSSMVLNDRNKQYLQNAQDCIYNGFRASRNGDALERVTSVYKKSSGATSDGTEEHDEEDDQAQDQQDEQQLGDNLDKELLNILAQGLYVESEQDGERRVPLSFSTRWIKENVRNELPSRQVAQMKPFELEELHDVPSDAPLVQVALPAIRQPNAAVGGNENEGSVAPSRRYSDVMQIIVHETSRMLRDTEYMDKKEISVANGSAESIVEWSVKSKLDEYQQEAFEVLIASYVLTFFDEENRGNISHSSDRFDQEKNKLARLADCKKRKNPNQLVALLHGPGGSGKSWVIDMVLQYAKEYTEYFQDFKFDKHTIVVTALTGSAATLIKGETVHSALQLYSSHAPNAETRSRFEQTRMVIVDEVSFANIATVNRMDTRLRQLKDHDELFGGVHMVFTGDFRQLDPVAAQPLYKFGTFRSMINCYVELKGKHRYADDVEWGEFLWKFRDGTITAEEIDEFNAYLACKRREGELPKNIKYATYSNADRDMINANLFDKAVDDGADSLVIFASDIKLKPWSSSDYKPVSDHRIVWNQVSESGARITGTQRMDPVLKVYRGMKVMLTQNIDVPNGIANGTEAFVTKVVLKPGEKMGRTLMEASQGNDRQVNSVLAKQVSYIELKHRTSETGFW